jgi:ABC-type branched-subunit amino acid transport system ATPase component
MTHLVVLQIHKSFGGVKAVDDVTFEVAPGEMVALIGPNGAGKSTTFNVINGQLPPDSGDVRLDGRSLVGCSPQQIWRLGVGRTFQTAAVFGSMSVLENVQTVLMSRDRRFFDLWSKATAYQREEAMTLIEQVGLAEMAHWGCQALAYADVKRVELALALASAPRWLLMDEPTAGMAPAERQALMTLAHALAKQRHIGVLFTEHSMDVVFGYADRILVMAQGRLIAQGTPAEIQSNEQVQAVYFGRKRPAIGGVALKGVP